MLDREKLAKILAMTTSPHHGEARAAMNKANNMILDENMTWGDVLLQLAPAVSNVHITVHKGAFVAPEFYEAVDAWRVRTKR